MTRLSSRTLGLAAALGAALLVADVTPVSAQCATCPTPVVAFSPVVAQPVVVAPTVVRTGWYPGAWIDRMRLRRWNAATTVVAAPTYTAGFAPAATWAQPTFTTVNRPVITAFAPWQPVAQTSFMPVVQTSFVPAPVASSCCPQTVMRPVEVAPIVQTVVAPACSACSVEAPCGGCSSCASGVSQASFVEATPVSTECPSCAATSGEPSYSSTVIPSSTPSGPVTPQPTLTPDVAAPAGTNYGTQRPAAPGETQSKEQSVVPSPGTDDEATSPEAEAGPEADASTSYEFQAPPLIAPQNDRTANRPTVDVHNAVYSQPARQGRVSATAAKVVAPQAAPAVDANGWYSVSERN